jgi:hypothetical protein
MDPFLKFGGMSIDTFSSVNHYNENQRRCSLHRNERSAARGQTVRDLVQGSGSLPDVPDGPGPRARTVRTCARAAEFTGGAWISLLGGTPSGRRDPRCCIGSASRPRLL